MAPKMSKLAGGGVFMDLTSCICSFFNFLTSATAPSKILLASVTDSSALFLMMLAALASLLANSSS